MIYDPRHTPADFMALSDADQVRWTQECVAYWLSMAPPAHPEQRDYDRCGSYTNAEWGA